MIDQALGGPPPAVEMRGIGKTFPGVRALENVDFTVAQGEIHALVGKNGAGKSTLIQILTGLYEADTGTIAVRGRQIDHMTTVRARQAGIAVVAQHVRYVPSLSIAENLFGGMLPTRRGGFVDWRGLNRLAAERLALVGLDIDVGRKMEGLTVAERQMIEIARALFADAGVIVLDEPTAPLPKHDVRMLFGFVQAQRERGASFVYISHYLEEVFAIADRVTVLWNGSVVGVHAVPSITQPELIRMISGTTVERFRRPAREVTGQPLLEISGLSRPGAYQDVELTVHPGEVVGLTGLEGCGNGALARGLFGLEPLGTGDVRIDERPYRATNPSEAIARGVAYLPRDRHGLGIVAHRSVRDNVALSVLRRLARRGGFISGRAERELVGSFIERLGIKTAGMAQPVEFLSGGNQQKVVVAKLVATRPRLLILDEPTQGVDVQAKVEILRIVDDLTRTGVGVLIISDELIELTDTCDRILVMHRGAIVARFDKGKPGMTHERILQAFEGGVLDDVA